MRTLIAALLALSSTPALAEQCNQLPVLFIVQDKSGSMTSYAPDGSLSNPPTNPSKWSIAKEVVPTLAQQFSNRFRFGAEMFPTATQQWNCSAPSVVAEVASLPDGVVNAFAAVPGGATPTRAALDLAKSHLLGLGLTTPTYVLLITDGLPNCNAALPPATCQTTHPTCTEVHCGVGAIDCLDDQATTSSAAALFAAGIKVFVVGFGSETSGNDKTVLDAIAKAGGTTSAYSAMNKAELTQVLNTIALNTTTCCNDACQSGTRCASNGQVQTCTYDPATKCKGWVNSNCPDMSSCSNGQCQACTNACTLGAVQCGANGQVQSCVKNSAGCTEWTTAQVCNSGEVCSNGMCGSCQACTVGSTQCGPGGLQTCEKYGSNCSRWATTACPPGSMCTSGACTSCNTACTAGTTRCVGKGVETCVADTFGCTAWQPTQECATFCSGGACGTCGTTCKPGDTRCNGAGVETCQTDANSCPIWGPAQQCRPGSFCNQGQCTQCTTSCTQGTKRCAANGSTEQCQLDTMGCTAWVKGEQCDLAAGDHCTDGACIPQCHDACTLGAAQCSPTGVPQSCVTAATGCTEWKNQSACAGTELCIEGTCRAACADDEFHTCPPGTVCTGTSAGGYCLPGDAGVYMPIDAGSKTDVVDAGTSGGADAGVHGSGSIGATAMGCGCMSFEGAALPLFGLIALGLRRRRLATRHAA